MHNKNAQQIDTQQQEYISCVLKRLCSIEKTNMHRKIRREMHFFRIGENLTNVKSYRKKEMAWTTFSDKFNEEEYNRTQLRPVAIDIHIE